MKLYDNLSQKSRQIANEYSFDTEIKQSISDFVTTNTSFDDVYPLRNAGDYLKANLGWVYACISIISDEIAAIDLELYETRGNEIVEIEDHPILNILYKANNFTTKFDLFYLTQTYLELTGEAPWYIAKDRSGIPTDIILLRPDLLTIVTGKDDEYVGGYKYRIGDGKELLLEPDEVVFIKYPDEVNQFRGKGTLEAAARIIDIDNYSENFNRNFFKNSATPAAILKTEQKLNKDTIERLKYNFNKSYGGNKNANKTMILEAGLDFKPLTLSQKDMDFLKQQEFSRDKILGIFRVPKSVLGLTNDVNRANGEVGDVVFAKRTIKPKMQRLIEQLNEFFLPMFPNTENMYLSYEDPVPENNEFKLAMFDNALRNGWLTRNEIREEAGFDNVGEEADKLYVPANYVEIGTTFGAPQQTPEERSMRKQLNGRNKEKKFVEKKKVELEKNIADKMQPIVKDLLTKEKNELKKKNNDEDKSIDIKNEEFWSKKVKAAEDFEKDWTRELKALFNAQEKEVLATFGKKAKEINPEDHLLDEEENTQKMIEIFTALVSSVILAGISDGEDLVDEAVKLNTEKIIAGYADDVAKFSKFVTEETNSILKDILEAGLKEGQSVAQIKKEIKSAFKDFGDIRSERIARSETIRASNYGTQKVYEEAGIEQKEWYTSLDQRVCQWCGPQHGKIVSTKEYFYKKGDRVTGADGSVLKLNYSSTPFPPLHPNCRCTILPVIK